MNLYHYVVTEQGEIISPVTKECLSYHVDKKGYHRVRIKFKGKARTWLVHRVIATVFIPNPDGLPQVNHKDGNKANNSVVNLEWSTGKKNVDHAVATGLIPRGKQRANAKFSDNDIREIRIERSKGRTFYELADKYGCSYQGVHKICSGQTYTHVT